MSCWGGDEGSDGLSWCWKVAPAMGLIATRAPSGWTRVWGAGRCFPQCSSVVVTGRSKGEWTMVDCHPVILC
jgi:hypothetical protein